MQVRGIRWVGVRTDRIPEMRAFATEVLGLRVGEHDEDAFVELLTVDGSRLELFAARAAAESPELFARNDIVAGLLVDDIEVARGELERTPGVELLGEVRSIASGYSWLHFRAPDGHVYEIVSDPEAHRAPSEPSRRAGPFVPDDFVVPVGLMGPGFRLEPLGPQHNEADHRAWTSSIEHIRATPGFPDGQWPPVEGLSLDANLRDLQRHADDFKRRAGFTYTVLDDRDRVVGCVYIYPSRSDTRVAQVQSWVIADRAELDLLLHDTVANWLATEWPFTDIRYRTAS